MGVDLDHGSVGDRFINCSDVGSIISEFKRVKHACIDDSSDFSISLASVVEMSDILSTSVVEISPENFANDYCLWESNVSERVFVQERLILTNVVHASKT
jgi:hypothetical protein